MKGVGKLTEQKLDFVITLGGATPGAWRTKRKRKVLPDPKSSEEVLPWDWSSDQ